MTVVKRVQSNGRKALALKRFAGERALDYCEDEYVVYRAIMKAAPAATTRLLHLEYCRRRPEPCLATLWCGGGDLYDFLYRQTRPLPPRVVWGILNSLAEAVGQLHAVGYYHCDLKPGNIFLRGADPSDLVLGDFGLCELIASNEPRQREVGTRQYRAPELYGKPEFGFYGAEVDWWAYGVIVADLVLGQMGWPEDALAAVNARLCTREGPVCVFPPCYREFWPLFTHTCTYGERWDHTQIAAELARIECRTTLPSSANSTPAR